MVLVLVHPPVEQDRHVCPVVRRSIERQQDIPTSADQLAFLPLPPTAALERPHTGVTILGVNVAYSPNVGRCIRAYLALLLLTVSL